MSASFNLLRHAALFQPAGETIPCRDSCFSCFSARIGETAYLEEDDDYALFCQAKAARGESVSTKRVHREYNPVRDYPGYYD
ncbi:hypothetical protein [Cardiobacterium hominis]